MLDGFLTGVKALVETAVVIWLIYTILIIAVYHPIYLTMMKWLFDLTAGFNPAIYALIVTIGSILHVDSLYLGNTTLPLIPTLFAGVNTTHVAIITQTMYSFVMLLVPTSIVLIFGLTYLDVPYKLWLKFVWKLAFLLFVLISIVISILTSTYVMLIVALVIAILIVAICKFKCSKTNK
jgi:uncharacterized ion transporter superfamily protein YfcC